MPDATREDGASLGPLLDRAARRLGLAGRVARATWLAIGAVVALEAGALAARGVGTAGVLSGGVAAASLAGAAAFVVLAGRRPSRVEAARALDGRLGTGALLETAAEARGPFAGVVERQAHEQLAAADLAQVVPVEAPRGLALGLSATFLLAALVVGPVEPGTPAPGEEPGVEIALGAPAPRPAGGAPAPAGKPPVPARIELTPGPPPSTSPASAALDPALARRLEERLRELAPALAARGNPAWSASLAREKAAADALEQALAQGDAGSALAALDALQATGTAASADRVHRAAEQLAARGSASGGGEGTSGAGGGSSDRPSTGTPAGARTSVSPGGAALEDSWRVREAVVRYARLIE